MANKNYKKGRRKEYRICKKLGEEGFDIAQRSAGSHSPIDVWAVDKENKEILLVQSKPGDISKDKEEELNRMAELFFHPKKGTELDHPNLNHFKGFVIDQRPDEGEEEEQIPTSELCDFCGGTKRIPGLFLMDKVEGNAVFPDDYIPGEPYQPEKARWIFKKIYFPCVCMDPHGQSIDRNFLELRNKHVAWYKEAMRGEWGFCSEGLMMSPQHALHDYFKRVQNNDWADPADEGDNEPEESEKGFGEDGDETEAKTMEDVSDEFF